MATERSVLLKVSGNKGLLEKAAGKAFGAAGGQIETILSVPANAAKGAGVAPAGPVEWVRMALPDTRGNLWDAVHALYANTTYAAAATAHVMAAEPDIAQQWPYADQSSRLRGMAAAGTPCAFEDQDTKGGKAAGPGLAWQATADFGQLGPARAAVSKKDQAAIIIAHLDTGYDPAHATLPAGLARDLQKNFVDAGFPDDATDRVPTDALLMANPGHGTGTLSLLAGNQLGGTSPGWPGIKDFIGGAPFARIVPIRIADWVVRFSTSTMVKGFDHARKIEAHVLSMSMGGLASQALTDAVNLAYEAGMVMVTAAGNNYAGLPTPGSTVFPARFQRVLAACGVMANGAAYADLKRGTMQGNFGPAEKMATALGAYTPNVPWAKFGCQQIVDMDGAGTSAATPQIAAAAALWLAQHRDAMEAYSEPWMRIHAVRNALFASARKSTSVMDEASTRRKVGQGIMQAMAALAVLPLTEAQLKGSKLPPARATWSFLDLILGHGGVSLAVAGPAALTPRDRMLALELTQVAQRVTDVDEAIDDPERPAASIPAKACLHYLEAALDQGSPSAPLAAVLRGLMKTPAPPPSKGPPTPQAPVLRKAFVMPTPKRRLRVYALDPSIAKKLVSLAVNETTLTLPWDDTPDSPFALAPGPVGEYLEVVDVDPASNMAYDPIDLNHPFVLAQDGLTPSEGNPQFHQQMVYAVGMTTIRHFEMALGRQVLWRARTVTLPDGKVESYEVPRLRIYPHALRTDNAYYSPDKVALLFGYFSASSQDGDATAPGSMVFSCLSSDIIAHEMSHALLDGLHRSYEDASNPDVPAFHEAFADIVALFQHFTVTELVRFEIASAHGDLSAASLLGGLARQFGEGTSRAGPLRDYTQPAAMKLKYEDAVEVHERGSILVYAVYEAFQNIVARRTEDLRRLATGGSGILPQGALPAELIDRLTDETCKVARHVLHMAIRALDYCPSVDITFGEYLRAMITVDIDVMPDDRYGYRVAFIEAFRNRGILPRSVRTISQESLAWDTPQDPTPTWLRPLLDSIDIRWNRRLQRSEVFRLNESNRLAALGVLQRACLKDPALYQQFGLVGGVDRYNEDGTPKHAAAPGGTTFSVASVRPVRRVASDGSFRTDINVVIQQRQRLLVDPKDPKGAWFWFRGGATLILDARYGWEAVRYAIVKDGNSVTRQERQRTMQSNGEGAALAALYFGSGTGEPFAMMHAFGGTT
ncbi:MAG: S8 family serine peptidase [Luteibacter sp.]